MTKAAKGLIVIAAFYAVLGGLLTFLGSCRVIDAAQELVR